MFAPSALLALSLIGSATAAAEPSAPGAQVQVGPSRLAPTWQEFREASRRLEQLLEETGAVATALFRTQNHYVERRVADGRPRCDQAWVGEIAARARLFGHALRDAAQSCRMQMARVERLTQSPTVAPLIDARMRTRVDELLGSVDRFDTMYREAAAWQARVMEPVAHRCEPLLQPADGFERSWAVAPSGRPPARERDEGEDEQGFVAVLTLGDGYICPGAEPAGGVVVVRGREACYGTAECACSPEPVLAGAVLGPAASQGSEN